MLKFTELNEGDLDRVAAEIFGADEYAKEILESFDFSDEDVYFATALSYGCMLIRIFDFGRYTFLYPIELNDDADPVSAFLEVCEYARREEIGLSFADVPVYGIDSVLSLGFMHLDIDKEDEDSYRVRIKTECELAPSDIDFTCGDLTLSELTDADKAEYAELCRDESVNRLFGYDYKEDMPGASDEYFLSAAREGRMLGSSMTLAIRSGGRFIGEVQFFAFDGRGECEVAYRILPKYQGRGFGSSALEAAIELAGELKLKKLSCDVLKANKRSMHLVEKYFDISLSDAEDRNHYTRIIE